jgi:hypothetical protein
MEGMVQVAETVTVVSVQGFHSDGDGQAASRAATI